MYSNKDTRRLNFRLNEQLYYTIKDIHEHGDTKTFSHAIRMLLWMGIKQYKENATDKRRKGIEDVEFQRNTDVIIISELPKR